MTEVLEPVLKDAMRGSCLYEAAEALVGQRRVPVVSI